jgi:hypothetical protein
VIGAEACFNNIGWTPGVNFSPRVTLAPMGELCPLKGLFIPSFTPRGEHSLMFRRTKGQTEGLLPWGDNFTPIGQSSPLGVKLKTSLSCSRNHIRTFGLLRPWDLTYISSMDYMYVRQRSWDWFLVFIFVSKKGKDVHKVNPHSLKHR